MYFKESLKGITLTDRTLYRCGIDVLGKDIQEYNKRHKKRQQDDKHLIILRKNEKFIKSVFRLTMTKSQTRRNKTGTYTLHSIGKIT